MTKVTSLNLFMVVMNASQSSSVQHVENVSTVKEVTAACRDMCLIIWCVKLLATYVKTLSSRYLHKNVMTAPIGENGLNPAFLLMLLVCVYGANFYLQTKNNCFSHSTTMDENS